MVGRERPVASATAVMPPHPMAIASQAAQRRRTFSSNTGRSAWYLFRMAAMISESGISDRGSLCLRDGAFKGKAMPSLSVSIAPCPGGHAFSCKVQGTLAWENTLRKQYSEITAAILYGTEFLA